jgi:RNA polymerase sigma-70 factor (ECF subfamily)
MEVDEFAAATEPYRREILVHCYRMLGSVHDAEDLVQETMVRALRARARYDAERATIRTWLYRIATNACLTAIERRARRPLPSGVGPVFDDPDAPFAPGLEVPWLQPFPTAPDTAAVERSQLRLALVAALQLLPPRQRAALLLRDVLDLSAAEVAELLGTTSAGVNSALQRARTRIAELGVDPDEVAEPAAEQRALIDRYVDAFERADVATLTSLLAMDVVLEMPPMWNWYRGVEHFGRFIERVYRLRGTGWTCEPLWANGEAAFAAYLDGALHTVQIFSTSAGRITRATVYQDDAIFELFGLHR